MCFSAFSLAIPTCDVRKEDYLFPCWWGKAKRGPFAHPQREQSSLELCQICWWWSSVRPKAVLFYCSVLSGVVSHCWSSVGSKAVWDLKLCCSTAQCSLELCHICWSCVRPKAVYFNAQLLDSHGAPGNWGHSEFVKLDSFLISVISIARGVFFLCDLYRI